MSKSDISRRLDKVLGDDVETPAGRRGSGTPAAAPDGSKGPAPTGSQPGVSAPTASGSRRYGGPQTFVRPKFETAGSAKYTRVSTPGRAVERRSSPLLGVFGAGLVLYVIAAWVAAYILFRYNADGTARIVQAAGVFFSRDPHLAAIGFVWPPLPVTVNLPLVLLLKPFGLVLMAGPVMSAIFGAFALTQLWEVLRRFDVPAFWRVLWVLLFGAHPLILQNATMGLSEAPFVAFLLMSLNGFLMWERDRQPGGLAWAGIGAMLALGCRYEGVAWVAAVVAAIFWQLMMRRSWPWESPAIGSVVAFVTPPVWGLASWMIMNWQIMGNPIHFLVGPGSTATTPDTARAVGLSHPFAFALGSVGGSLQLVLLQAQDLAPLLVPALPMLLVVALLRGRWGDLAYLILGASILAFTTFTAFQGLLPHFSRYFVWTVPGGLILAGATYRALGDRWPRLLAALATTVLLLVPAYSLPAQIYPRMSEPFPQRVLAAMLIPREYEDPDQAKGRIYGSSREELLAISAYLDSEPGKVTLVDAALGGALMLFMVKPQDLSLTTDRDFFDLLFAPRGRASQMLVPYPSFDALGRSDIMYHYPDLYGGNVRWAKLVKEFPGPTAWRLFEIVGTPVPRDSAERAQ